MGNFPTHLAIIPDGNRRWARARKLPPWEGHREGANRFREIVAAVFDAGIPYFTFWSGSEDNFQRDPTEVKKLLSFAGAELERELKSGD
ncbi:MAG: undecaprenyl diphosphate synthase family protein, partial [candidate division WWE3 bacterium]|nr:undecaprenyl diphosphate synthase family protein [candidate division WWE3 bacterium]